MDVLYIGDEKLESNHFFSGAESFQVFQQRIEDYEPLLEALEEIPQVNVEHMGGRETIVNFPESLETLQEYDVLIISDLSRGTLLPHFLPDAIPGPNRLRIIKEFVEEGGGLIFCGGWMSFQGYHGVGNWQGSL
ncbi:MAG: glutamine amidotransferase, partial [Halobacteriaceae archaeon]